MKVPILRSAAAVLALAGVSFTTVKLVAATQVTAPTGPIVPLFNKDTKQEPNTTIDTPEALITRFGDRSRDRHAREGMFKAYDHFLAHYWDNRTVSIEIIDRVAKGGKDITYNMTSLFQLNGPNLRLFFEGKGTVAQYTNNMVSKQIDPLHYTATISQNTNEKRPLKIGDRIEMEFSPFLKPPVEGRTNYYGTAFLYVVGKGIAPWEGRGPLLDSFPMPDEALLGGAMTNHRQYSNEPKELFKQMATNVAPIDTQPFVHGRRLQHSDFNTGMHSEPGNPVFKEIVGKLGDHFVGTSCISCHINNGRALPAKVGEPMTKYLVRVGIDAKGTPHPQLGATLQSQSKTKGQPGEADVTVASFTEINGTYADGTPFTVRKPVYKFSGVTPEFFSVRLAPQLVGQGLLEAIDESTVAAMQSQNKAGKLRTVSDPETGQTRLGRFGWKGGQARLKQQIAAALNNDMGVPTPIFPTLDRGSAQPAVTLAANAALPAEDLENMFRYVALLGIPPRRNMDDPAVIKGEQLFTAAQCSKCHTPVMKTSPYHPMAELRNQTIRPFTDLMLHDMGPGLAENMAEGTASPSEWRTAPLWGIGATAGVSGGEAYLHDGRARNLAEAILWHGGEAQPSREAFWKMAAADRDALVKFLQSL